MPHVALVLAAMLSLFATLAHAKTSNQCGEDGVWVQILGSGGAELTDARAAPSYLVWVDDHARLLVDPGPGSALRFEESGANFNDLDVIAFSQLTADHSADLAALVRGSLDSERDRPLPVLGPEGNDGYPSMRTFLERFIGPAGVYPDLKDYLTFRTGSYKISATNVPATGSRRWARFGTENLRLAAIPVHHGAVPALAWRAAIGNISITFAGDFNNDGNPMQVFAKGTDALIVSLGITESSRGELRDLYALPSQLGRIAQEADARMLILGHRSVRTRGLETQTETKIRESYAGPLIFGNELECWGL
ncbi:MAG: MBL fold metallo-hydrolase [Gammaproteobacteria bacterium]|nr:MBL fold metallo-hydrolase [Gammaproteobacteria bacterium]